MQRYLLSDLGCGTCSGIVDEIKKEAGDVLVVRSLAEMEMVDHLDKALPNWKWEPMILEVSGDGQDVKVYHGVFMRLRLIQLLGISKAWRVASMVYKSVPTMASLQERRSFLKYSGGVLTGLAVLGLRPFQSTSDFTFQTDGIEIRGRQLTGNELIEAVTEARADGGYIRFSNHLSGKGYSEDRGRATAFLAEATDRSPILLVEIPFVNGPGGKSAEMKYQRHASEIEVVAGIVHSDAGQPSAIDVHEIVSGRVKHTTTLRRENGEIIEEPVGEFGAGSSVLVGHGDNAVMHHDGCTLCKDVCWVIKFIFCRPGRKLLCSLVCLYFSGPALAACPWICRLLILAVCGWGLNVGCSKLCKMMGQCP